MTATGLLITRCAHWPETPPLMKANMSGYRLTDNPRPEQSDESLVIFAMSGGAAALSYGVREELRRTNVTVNGVKRRLIDEVDVIAAVSGCTPLGMWPAVCAYTFGRSLATTTRDEI